MSRWRVGRFTRRVWFLLRLPPRYWRKLALAQIELLKKQWMLRTRRPGSFVTVVSTPEVQPAAASLAEARDWAKVVGWAARHGVFRPKCLVRSLALVTLLERAGITGASVRAGVQYEGGQFAAHAWVELADVILTDPRDYVARFQPLADLRVFQETSR